jgi:hypothetical protein
MGAIQRTIQLAIIPLAAIIGDSATRPGNAVGDEGWRFVSMPDFLNVDTDYPQAGWEEAVGFILQTIKAEQPEFLLVAGDLVMGRWHGEADKPGVAGIEHFAARYYPAWKARLESHGLKYYAALGDHELGDNPWRYPDAVAHVAAYKQAFREYLNMPRNGPDHMRGTAFYWTHGNVLFLAVDVFEPGQSDQGVIRPGVTGAQLAWMERVIETHPDADHVIVMGHAPVLGPVRQWSSSGLMVTGGRESEFWQAMSRRKVALYLCGEVHAITCTQRDGVQQIAHGGLIGYNTRTNYLVVDVYPDRLDLTLKEIDMLPSGEKLWQPGNNRPLERVEISPEIRQRGFLPVGKLTVDTQSNPRRFRNAQGYFLPEYEISTERARPVFSENFKPLPRIRLDGQVDNH